MQSNRTSVASLLQPDKLQFPRGPMCMFVTSPKSVIARISFSGSIHVPNYHNNYYVYNFAAVKLALGFFSFCVA